MMPDEEIVQRAFCGRSYREETETGRVVGRDLGDRLLVQAPRRPEQNHAQRPSRSTERIAPSLGVVLIAA